MSTGNIANDDLIALFEANLEAIQSTLADARFVELATDRLIVHRSDRPRAALHGPQTRVG